MRAVVSSVLLSNSGIGWWREFLYYLHFCACIWEQYVRLMGAKNTSEWWIFADEYLLYCYCHNQSNAVLWSGAVIVYDIVTRWDPASLESAVPFREVSPDTGFQDSTDITVCFRAILQLNSVEAHRLSNRQSSNCSHGFRPITGFLCLSVFMFQFYFFLILVFGHVRRTKMASSLVDSLTHVNLFSFDWFDSTILSVPSVIYSICLFLAVSLFMIFVWHGIIQHIHFTIVLPSSPGMQKGTQCHIKVDAGSLGVHNWCDLKLFFYVL